MERIVSLLSYIQPIQDELIGLAFALVTAALLYFFRSKVKLQYGRANNSRNVVFSTAPDEGGNHSETEIYVEKYFLQNMGRKAATNVEFVLSHYPTDVSVWQPREVEYKNVEKGNCLIKIPQIAPRELIVIDCLYVNREASWVTSVKCAESLGVEVPFWTLRRFPQWVYYCVSILLLLGVASVVQILLKLTGN